MRRRNYNIYVDAAVRVLVLSLGALLALGLLAALCSCRTCRESVSQDSIERIEGADSLLRVRWRIDSVHVTDSVVTVIRGDTVTTDRWHKEYRDRLRVDTIERVKWRTICRTRTVTVRINSSPSGWQRMADAACAALALVAAIAGVWWIIRAVRRRRQIS